MLSKIKKIVEKHCVSMCCNDPILCLLVQKLKISPGAIGLIFSGLTLSMIIWAVNTSTWSSIDYPLKSSYVTWIGDLVLAVVNIYIIKYLLSISEVFRWLNQTLGIEVENNQRSPRSYIVIILSAVASFLYHESFMLDNLHGWTEADVNSGLSGLGYFHAIYFWIEMSIVANFCVTAIFGTLVLGDYAVLISKNQHSSSLSNISYDELFISIKTSNASIKVVLSLIGVYLVVLVITLLSFHDPKSGMYLWQALEGSWVIIYAVLAPIILRNHTSATMLLIETP